MNSKLKPGQIWFKVSDNDLWDLTDNHFSYKSRIIVLLRPASQPDKKNLYKFKFLYEPEDSGEWNAYDGEEIITNFKFISELTRLERIIFNIKESGT